MDRYDHYLAVGLAFAESLKARPDVRGVILAGSWLEGDPAPHADIDVPVILTPDAATGQHLAYWRGRAGGRPCEGMGAPTRKMAPKRGV